MLEHLRPRPPHPPLPLVIANEHLSTKRMHSSSRNHHPLHLLPPRHRLRQAAEERVLALLVPWKCRSLMTAPRCALLRCELCDEAADTVLIIISPHSLVVVLCSVLVQDGSIEIIQKWIPVFLSHRIHVRLLFSPCLLSSPFLIPSLCSHLRTVWYAIIIRWYSDRSCNQN